MGVFFTPHTADEQEFGICFEVRRPKTKLVRAFRRSIYPFMDTECVSLSCYFVRSPPVSGQLAACESKMNFMTLTEHKSSKLNLSFLVIQLRAGFMVEEEP